jgi:hypothetical protein
MDQINARRKKLAAGRYFIILYFATLVNALEHLSKKLTPRYNYKLLQICSGQ